MQLWAYNEHRIDQLEDMAGLAIQIRNAQAVRQDGTFYYKTFKSFFDRDAYYAPKEFTINQKSLAELQMRLNKEATDGR